MNVRVLLWIHDDILSKARPPMFNLTALGVSDGSLRVHRLRIFSCQANSMSQRRTLLSLQKSLETATSRLSIDVPRASCTCRQLLVSELQRRTAEPFEVPGTVSSLTRATDERRSQSTNSSPVIDEAASCIAQSLSVIRD